MLTVKTVQKILCDEEKAFFASLTTPHHIQDYLDSIPFNHEEEGETCRSPRSTLIHKKAHCLEGALLAYIALLLQNRKPHILSLKTSQGDDDHVVVLYKENGHWGALSKTNHTVLKWRDPVYKTPRELAMSYFNEYFLQDGTKTMIGYSSPITLNELGSEWIISEKNLFSLGRSIMHAKHTSTIPKGSKQHIRKADKLECLAASISYDTKTN